ncbi:MAG: dienelactone hydrolase family protein [Myxococcales bacterium]
MERQVRVIAGPVELEGSLAIPEGATGLVLFAHGSGSSRFSPRNQRVAMDLNERGLGTLLFDLLSAEEEEVDILTRELRFDIDFLAQRVIDALEWAAGYPETSHLKFGLFGSSTGAAAALVTAARRPRLVSAVVSRGGRADLAGEALSEVKAPTLLIVGGSDEVVLDLNRDAYDQLTSEKKLSIVPGATHLFEEPGALQMVSRLAAEWFARYLGAPIGRLPWEGTDSEPLWP